MVNLVKLVCSGLKHDFDAAVRLVTECSVHLGSCGKIDLVSDHKGWIDLSVLDPTKQVIRPARHMRRRHSERPTFFHRLAHRNLVSETEVHPDDRNDASRSTRVDHL